jgi:hypothetical protein
VTILFQKEKEYDIIFRHAQLKTPRRQEKKITATAHKSLYSLSSIKFVPSVRASSFLWMHSTFFSA